MPVANKSAMSYEETESEVEETISEEETVDIDSAINDDVEALLSGAELTEEFKSKAKLVFEAALSAKVSEVEAQIQEEYEKTLAEEVESIKVELTERVDTYLEYVAQEWLEENALAVERGIKTQMTESFLDGLKELFETHYVSIPEDRYDVLESMVDKLDEMEEKLNEQIERNVALNKRLSETVAETIMNNVAEGLAISQKEKLASLAESVEFESEEGYREKLETLKEAYFPTKAGTPKETVVQELTEQADYTEVSSSMSAYLQALSTQAPKHK